MNTQTSTTAERRNRQQIMDRFLAAPIAEAMRKAREGLTPEDPRFWRLYGAELAVTYVPQLREATGEDHEPGSIARRMEAAFEGGLAAAYPYHLGPAFRAGWTAGESIVIRD